MDKKKGEDLYKWYNSGTKPNDNQDDDCSKSLVEMVGATGFEPATSWTPFEKGAFFTLFISVEYCVCYVAIVYYIKIFNYS